MFSYDTPGLVLQLFSDTLRRSSSECPKETNNIIPTGKQHLSNIDLLEVTTNTESFDRTCQYNILGTSKSNNKPLALSNNIP